MSRLPRFARLPLLLLFGCLLMAGMAGGMLWLDDHLRLRNRGGEAASQEYIEAQERRFSEAQQRLPRLPPVPADPLAGRRFSGKLAEICRQKTAAYRQIYREKDWASNYYLARAIIQRREAEQLERTNGATSWKPSPSPEAEELDALITRAVKLSRTSEEKRRTRLLEPRAFEPPASRRE